MTARLTTFIAALAAFLLTAACPALRAADASAWDKAPDAPGYARASAHEPNYADRAVWPLTGKEAFAKETWPKARLLVWARPGTSGALDDAANWLEAGRPAAKPPDRETDVVLPAAGKGYRATKRNGEVRHATVGRNAMIMGGHRGELEVWGNLWVKDGGRAYFVAIRGPGHTFFRMDRAAFPTASNGLKYGHTGKGAGDWANRSQISHKFQFCKYGDGSSEFIGNFGVSDEIMIQHGRLVLSGHLRWSGVTGKGALEIYDGGVLELQSGSTAGPFLHTNAKGVYNIDIYRNGTLQAGSPKRPLTADCRLMLGYAEADRAGRSGLYAAAGSHLRTFSADPARHRLVVTSLVSDPDYYSGQGRRLGDPGRKASGTAGVSMDLAGSVRFDGVLFDYVGRGGIRLADPSVRNEWTHVAFGPSNAAGPDDLFGKVTVDPHVYYHKRGDGQSEYGLTVKAVSSMAKFMEEEDPYEVRAEPPASRMATKDVGPSRGHGRKGAPVPVPVLFEKPVEVTLSNALGAPMHYTTDGTDPTPESPKYTRPVRLTETTQLKVRAYQPGRDPSAPFAVTYTFKE